MSPSDPPTSVSNFRQPAEAAPSPAEPARLPVPKTYKIYLNGAFSRSESGRTYALRPGHGGLAANVCLCSRKDVRDAVAAARTAQPAWSGATAYLRGQILYRIAEMLEGRSDQFVGDLARQGDPAPAAQREVHAAIDRLIYFAGWSDKIQQVFGSVNPVGSSHFSFSTLEPTGVVALIAPETSGLLGLVSTLAPILVGGNTCVILASHARPISAMTLAEVLETADVPPGAVNILTGRRDELLEPIASHMDVNAVVWHGDDDAAMQSLREAAAANVKRVLHRRTTDWFSEAAQHPYLVLDTMEVKTTWHPVGS